MRHYVVEVSKPGCVNAQGDAVYLGRYMVRAAKSETEAVAIVRMSVPPHLEVEVVESTLISEAA